MSHQAFYDQLSCSAYEDGYQPSAGSGATIHCGLANIDHHHKLRAVDDHDSHVLAWLGHSVNVFINAMFRQDVARVCTPSAERVVPEGLPVPVAAAPGECSDLAAYVKRPQSDCPPMGVNEASAPVTADPEVSDPWAGTIQRLRPLRLSNLDAHGKLVKKGRKVSYGGLRGLVTKVNRGRCFVGYLDAFDRFTGQCDRLVCERVQVVA